MRKTAPSSNIKFSLIRVVFLMAFLLIITRLFQIQVLNASKYRSLARNQQWEVEPAYAKRGDILTADGFPLATSVSVFDVFANFTEMKDVDNTVKMVRDIEGMNKDVLDNEDSYNKKWIKIGENISWDNKELISGYKLPGLYFEEEYKRIYPEGTMLGHVLGFIGLNKTGQNVGYYGLEQFYNGDLIGQDGVSLREKSAEGNPILWGRHNKIEVVHGSDIHLTIDRSVQFIAETAIKKGVEKYNAKSGTIIIVEPWTGKIIAMANAPVFDPNNFKDDDSHRNNAISSLYEPGSVIKAITMSSAIDMKTVTPNTVYSDTGPKYFSGHLVDNWDGKHHGDETMIEVLQHSNNLGASWVGLKVGDKNLMKYFNEFGFGQKTNIDLDGEEAGIVYKDFPMKDIEIVNASFGQGVSMTPLQMTMAFAAIANDGSYMKPYIVEKIDKPDDTIFIKPTFLRSVISKESADTMVDMLTQAVSGGEAKYFILKNYKIAGKTGTAQVPIPGGYDENRTNATFIGFFPSYKNFVMLLKLEEPTFPSGYSAETAVPLWMEVAEKLANYYGLAPDIENVSENETETPDANPNITNDSDQ